MVKYIVILSIILGRRKFGLGFPRLTKTTRQTNRQGLGALISNSQLLWTAPVSMFAAVMANREAISNIISKILGRFNYVYFE